MKHKGTVCIVFGLLLMAAALLLTARNMIEGNTAGEISQEDISLLREEIAEEAEIFIPDYILNPAMDMPQIEINGRMYIGTITVPAIDIDLPVLSRWSYDNLKISPCLYQGSVYMDDMVLLAHNYVTHFGKIRQLNIGDDVVFTDTDGNVFTFKVAETEILAPYAVEEMVSSGYPLTLFTCSPSGQNRVAVRCEKN